MIISKGKADYHKMLEEPCRRHRHLCVRFYLLLSVCLFLWGCAAAPLPEGIPARSKLMDGTYEGSYRAGPNKAVVRVSIEAGTISRIDLVMHQAWRGRKAEGPVLERIIAGQSTRVDAVSGATNSSRVIMNAVQNAIQKAYSPQ